MNEYSIVVDFQKGNIYTDLSILVQNDYNAYKLNFEFDKEFERALFKLKYPVDNKEWVQDIVDNKLILPVLKDTGDYEYEISIYSEDGRLTGYATEKFHVRSELINTDEIVEPDDRVPILDNLINETTQLKNETASLKEEVEDAIEETNNLNIDVSKSGKIATVTLTKKDNTTKTVTLSDGTNLMFNWDDTKLGIKTDEDEEYTYVDLQGVQGPIGPQGEAFQIKKTYPSIAAMNADFNNMSLGDYVMIASEVSQTDNAKLYTRGESQWIFISDFSGAQGIRGETGATPNIQIGTVSSGNSPSVTRTGTNENPILNFVLQQGPQGEIGPTGATGETGNGILNIVKLSSIDNIDTYQINMTDGTNYQFTVTNSNVTNQEFNDLKNRYESLINTLPKVTGTGTDITLDNTSEYYMKSILNSTELTQDGTPASDNPVDVNVITGSNNVKIENKNIFNPNLLSQVENYNSYDTETGLWTTNSGGGYGRSILYSATSLAHSVDITKVIEVEPNVNYTIYFYDFNSNASNMVIDLDFCDKTGQNISSIISQNPPLITFTTPNNCRYLDLLRRSNSGTFSFSKIMLLKGTYTLQTLTEFVEHQEQNYPIILSSKNLAYTDWAEDFVSRINDTDQAELLTYDNRNCLKFRNDAGSGDHDNKYMLKIGWKENTQYTFVFNLLSVSGYFNFSIDYTDGTYSYINGSQSANEWRNAIWVSDANKTIKYLRVRNITGLSYVDLDTFMVLEGVYTSETIPDYIPYIANPIEYCKIGDYADQIFKNTKNSEFYDSTLELNEWYLKKNIGKVTFDGSDDEVYEKVYGTIKENKCLFTLKNVPHNDSDYNLIKSNRFEARQGLTPYYNEGINITVFHNYIGLILNADKLTEYTTDALRVFFQNNNTDVYLVTETPTYIHISETDYPILRSQLENLYNNAKSYKGQTNITQTNDGLPFNIELSALRDLSTL